MSGRPRSRSSAGSDPNVDPARSKGVQDVMMADPALEQRNSGERRNSGLARAVSKITNGKFGEVSTNMKSQSRACCCRLSWRCTATARSCERDAIEFRSRLTHATRARCTLHTRTPRTCQGKHREKAKEGWRAVRRRVSHGLYSGEAGAPRSPRSPRSSVRSETFRARKSSLVRSGDRGGRSSLPLVQDPLQTPLLRIPSLVLEQLPRKELSPPSPLSPKRHRTHSRSGVLLPPPGAPVSPYAVRHGSVSLPPLPSPAAPLPPVPKAPVPEPASRREILPLRSLRL